MEKFLDSILVFLENSGYSLIQAAVALVLGILIIRNLLKITKLMLVRSKMDNSLVSFVLTIEKILLAILLSFYCLSTVGISLTGFVAALSALTLAIGLAIQDIIGSVANGLMIVSTKPFKVNDYVEIGDIGGTIKEITLMHTILTTPDNKRIMLPNKTVFASEITNYSCHPTRRIEFMFGVDYDTNVETAKQVIMETISAHPLVLHDPAPFCRLKELADSEIRFVSRVWVHNSDYWTVYFDLMEQVYAAFEKNGIELAFPQVTLSYRAGEEKKS